MSPAHTVEDPPGGRGGTARSLRKDGRGLSVSEAAGGQWLEQRRADGADREVKGGACWPAGFPCVGCRPVQESDGVTMEPLFDRNALLLCRERRERATGEAGKPARGTHRGLDPHQWRCCP